MTVLAFTHEPVDIAVAAVVCVAMTAWIWWDHRPHRDKGAMTFLDPDNWRIVRDVDVPAYIRHRCTAAACRVS